MFDAAYMDYCMKICLCLNLSVILLLDCSISGAGKTTVSGKDHDCAGYLEKHVYKSSVIGPRYKSLYVYLPESYYDSMNRYPVAYFLHGANGNERSWIEKGNILNIIDSLVTSGEIGECIYVFPNTNRYCNDYDSIGSRPKKSVEAYLELNGSAEYSFINDIIDYIDSHFRTKADMKYRAIAGLSLGGLQALYISANTVDEFGHIGLFSPVIHPPWNLGRHSAIYRDMKAKLDAQFSASPSMYWILIGDDDPFYKAAYGYSRRLRRQEYDFNFIRTSGGHTWDNWICYSVLFLKSLW